jgi:hypothetical protein
MPNSYDLDVRKEINIAVTDLKSVRSSYEPFWRQADEHICPGIYRGQLTDNDRGERRDDSILNNTPHMAWLDHKAGMLTHASSPGTPWIRYKLEDQDLSEFGPVAQWFDDAARIQLEIYEEEAGVYDPLEGFYGNRAAFGPALMWYEERPETCFHLRNLAVGTWWVGLNEYGEADVVYREFDRNARSIVHKFVVGPDGKMDWSRVSARVKDAYDHGRYQEKFTIGHYVAPNERANPRYLSASEKRFKSCYFEVGDARGASSSQDLGFLNESGFDLFPGIYCPWDSVEEDVYGKLCPGRTILGDSMELQHDEEKLAAAVAKAVDPPTYGPPMFRKPGYLPGSYTPVPLDQLKLGGIQQLHDTNPQVFQLETRQERKENRIARGMYVDVFRMLDYIDDRDRTAFEISAREQERVRSLAGPTGRLHRRGLGPLANRSFRSALDQGRFPPIPEELEGQLVKVEYKSLMAQAMRSVGLAPIERVVGIVGQIAKDNPAIWDKLNSDQVIDEYAKGAGAPARIINDDETVAGIRSARAEQMAATQRMEMMAQATKSAKDLGSIKTDQPTALSEMGKVMAQAQEGEAA